MDIREISRKRCKLSNQINALKRNLSKMDYIDNKISAATAKYLVEGDKTELLALYEEYKPTLEQRQAWRDEINNLENQLKELAYESN
jgi:hypothetical protein